MHNRKPPPDALIARAAAARASGSSWEAVGKLVSRSPHTVCKWPQTYPEHWEAALRAAARAGVDYAAAQSMIVLRNLLASDNEKVRAEAAWRLLYQRLEQWKIEQKAGGAGPSEPIPTDAYIIAQSVKSTTHEERIKLLANLRTTRLPGIDGDRPVAPLRAG